MSGINKVIIIGNLGGDPESGSMPSGNAVSNFTVATSESWKDKDGAKQESTEWHRVTIFNRLAEVANQYLRKGSKVYIEGKLRTRKWDKDGQTHYTTEVIANQLQMLDSKSEGSQGRSQAPQQQSNQPPAEDFDDDSIPFN